GTAPDTPRGFTATSASTCPAAPVPRRHPARSSPSPRPSPATSSGTPVTSASTPAADRCTMPVPPDRAPRSAATAGWVTSPSSAFSDQLQRQLPVRLDGPRVERGAFVYQRTFADQRRGEADPDR